MCATEQLVGERVERAPAAPTAMQATATCQATCCQNGTA